MGKENVIGPHVPVNNTTNSAFFVKIPQSTSCSNCNFLACSPCQRILMTSCKYTMHLQCYLSLQINRTILLRCIIEGSMRGLRGKMFELYRDSHVYHLQEGKHTVKMRIKRSIADVFIHQ